MVYTYFRRLEDELRSSRRTELHVMYLDIIDEGKLVDVVCLKQYGLVTKLGPSFVTNPSTQWLRFRVRACEEWTTVEKYIH